jgi:hypothetical protein
MSWLQYLRFSSILTSILIGLWFPIRLIGYRPIASVEVGFDLLVSLISIVNIYLYFKENQKKPSDMKAWLSASVLLDALCVLPLSLIEFWWLGTTNEILLFINLLCARHIFRIKSFLDQFDSLQPIYYRLIPLVFTMPILVHLLACGWIALGSGSAGPDPDKVFEYVKALYWTFTTLTTVGYGDIVAKTSSQMFYAAGAQILGVAVFGYVLSNVASLLSRVDAAREHHMDNLDRVETFMRMHKIPDNLRLKTRAYYHYMWTNRKGYQDDTLLKDLPHKIQSELFFFINQSIIAKVPFLRGAQQELLEDLMNELEPRIFVPGEKIFRADEPGDALYFIQSGSVEILDRQGQALAALHEGAFFGEMALLEDKPRSATARATGFCDVYLLHKNSFERVIEAYPEFRHHMEEVMRSRTDAA